MTITAGMVKDLREKTGAGMMDCKGALAETNGDIEAAIDLLRKKGLAKAAKKGGRIAADGLIGLAVSGGKGAIVEVNSETDFVARGDGFQAFVREVSKLALKADGDLDRLLASQFPGGGTTAEALTHLIAKLGENMSIRRSSGLSVSPGVVASYIHNATGPDLGKIGVLVAVESSGDPAKIAALGKQIAMHIAAASPIAVTPADVPADVVARERSIFAEQAKESGKPANVIEKMVEGRLRKFYEEVVLLEQPFVHDPDLTVAKALAAAEKDAGAPIKITGFHRFALGEGIDRPDSDFAAEVAAAASGS
jgi:elongation factor Ts